MNLIVYFHLFHFALSFFAYGRWRYIIASIYVLTGTVVIYNSFILRKRYMTTFSNGVSLKNEICSLSLSLIQLFSHKMRSLLMSFYWIQEWFVSPSSWLAKRVNIKGSHINLLVITLRNTRKSNHIYPPMRWWDHWLKKWHRLEALHTNHKLLIYAVFWMSYPQEGQ